ncbi:hypothetical protein [Streptomyces sp. NBC_00648]|uniref:hypothetical protein n=1 Tax=Streptomyces sp. NBC_00648 TaxID=2975797 RepID=UPI003252D08D
MLHERVLQEPTGPITPRFADYVGDLAEIQQHVEERIVVPAIPDEEQIDDANQVCWDLIGIGDIHEGWSRGFLNVSELRSVRSSAPVGQRRCHQRLGGSLQAAHLPDCPIQHLRRRAGLLRLPGTF